nr:MAG TPA: hypothetical protein [Caudoviricetes sp.]
MAYHYLSMIHHVVTIIVVQHRKERTYVNDRG